MKHQNDPFKKAFDTLKNAVRPTEAPKEKILNQVLINIRRLDDNTVPSKLWKWASIYPWRFAFGVSAVQAVVFTLIFGTKYTNFFISFFGG